MAPMTAVAFPRPSRVSRRHPTTNRALAWNHFGWAKVTLGYARLSLDGGDRAMAAFWTEKAIEAHQRGRTYQRRLVAQGGINPMTATLLTTIPAPVANPGRTRFVVATSIELEAADTQAARSIIGALATYLAVGIITITDVQRIEAPARRPGPWGFWMHHRNGAWPLCMACYMAAPMNYHDDYGRLLADPLHADDHTADEAIACEVCNAKLEAVTHA